MTSFLNACQIRIFDYPRFAEPLRDTKGESRLLLAFFDRDKAHVWSAHGFTIGFGISRIIFVGLDVRFDELGRHQLNRMPQRFQFPCPEIGAVAGLHANQAALEVGEEWQHLVSLDLLL